MSILKPGAAAVSTILAGSGTRLGWLAQPWPFAIAYLVVALAAAAAMFWARRADSAAKRLATVVCGVGVLAVSYTGLITNAYIRHANTTEADVAALKRKLPSDARLVTLGRSHHLFAYYYRDPIPVLPRPTRRKPVPRDVEYFCWLESTYSAGRVARPPLGFRWERLAVISCDRYRRDPPTAVVVVARRRK